LADLYAPPRLREAPDDTQHDAQRIAWANVAWGHLDGVYRTYEWQVEENCRMIAGQQWGFYHPILNRYIDIAEFLDERDRLWKHRPVLNHMLPWFMLTLARLTENPPVLTFLPGPDRLDAILAEQLDTLFKILWRQTQMPTSLLGAMAWVVAAGRGHTSLYVDPEKGEEQEWVGRGRVPLLGPDGQPMRNGETGEVALSEEEFEGVPFSQQGVPYTMNDDNTVSPLAAYSEEGGFQRMGEPYRSKTGGLCSHFLSPLEVRGEWGPYPWHEKRLIVVRQWMTPERIYQLWGVEPKKGGSAASKIDAEGDSTSASRLLFGSGWFGAASGSSEAQFASVQMQGTIPVLQVWQPPTRRIPGMEKTDESPGGRYLVATPFEVITDGARPANFLHCSPIRTYEFVRVPGQPAAMSPASIQVGPQRAFNRTFAMIGTNLDLHGNPKPIIDKQAGLDVQKFTNEPGTGHLAVRRPSVPAVEWLQPPSMGTDTWRFVGELRAEMEFMGNLQGSGGDPPTPDPSGELIKELRFNQDRFFGPTATANIEEIARKADDFRVLTPIVYPKETILTYLGDDNIARTITLLPEAFESGKVNVIPDAESMLPEGRGERQAKVFRLWKEGAFGPPLEPVALKTFHELARFTHISRTAKPGGPDRAMAEHLTGMLARGTKAKELPFFDWYDIDIHLMVLEDIMKAPEFLQYGQEVQAEFTNHWNFLRGELEKMQKLQQQQLMQEQERAVQMQAQAKGGGQPEREAPGVRPKPAEKPTMTAA